MLPRFKTAKDLLVEVFGECPKYILLLVKERLFSDIRSDDIKIIYPEGFDKKLASLNVDVVEFFTWLNFCHKNVLQASLEGDLKLYVFMLD
ncbi:MAG: hypothetical protein N3F64_07585 [Nitrososphaeria archaeon]|nr:hypothetical protein [Nitrososphaeria archaeon]